MKKIKELQLRSSLNEGRNFGIGFSILKPLNLKKTQFETYLPFTACRDYLNDFSYVEYTKKEIGKIYGYEHKLLNCFDKKRTFYIGVNTLNYNSGIIWNDKDKAENLLTNNYKVLEKLLNKVEDKLNINHSTIKVDEDTLIIKAPIYWSKTTALISVYTLFIRLFFNIKDFNSDISEEEFINILKSHNVFIGEDAYYKKECINFYSKMKDHDFTKINYNNLNIKEKSQIHNFGIQGYLKKVQ